MEKNIGQLIKDKVTSSNISISHFAAEIGKERSNVYDIFKRNSVDTLLLKKIGQVLNYDFFQDLLEEKTIKNIQYKAKSPISSNKVYIEIELTDDEISKYQIKDKIIKKLIL